MYTKMTILFYCSQVNTDRFFISGAKNSLAFNLDGKRNLLLLAWDQPQVDQSNDLNSFY